MLAILEKIRKSFEILKLEDDWDDDGAMKANLNVFNKAMVFIHLLIAKVDNLSVPEIDLCRDGSIDFDFRNKDYRLLVNVQVDHISCYGDNGDNGNVIKSPDITMDIIVEWCHKFMVTL
jgi:hypothetical protein